VTLGIIPLSDPSLIENEKKALRAAMSAQRLAVSAAERNAAADGLRVAFSAYARGMSDAALVAGYMPIRSEANILPLMADLAERRIATALPVVIAKGMALEFRRWRAGEPLEDGLYGTHHPVGMGVWPTVLLIPLLAFDPAGFRLGYGGGFYDRTLDAYRAGGMSVVAIGVAYACQQVPHVPRLPHDQPLDAILTERGLLWSNGAA